MKYNVSYTLSSHMSSATDTQYTVHVHFLYMLWFKFISGSNFFRLVHIF